MHTGNGFHFFKNGFIIKAHNYMLVGRTNGHNGKIIFIKKRYKVGDINFSLSIIAGKMTYQINKDFIVKCINTRVKLIIPDKFIFSEGIDPAIKIYVIRRVEE